MTLDSYVSPRFAVAEVFKSPGALFLIFRVIIKVRRVEMFSEHCLNQRQGVGLQTSGMCALSALKYLSDTHKDFIQCLP